MYLIINNILKENFAIIRITRLFILFVTSALTLHFGFQIHYLSLEILPAIRISGCEMAIIPFSYLLSMVQSTGQKI